MHFDTTLRAMEPSVNTCLRVTLLTLTHHLFVSEVIICILNPLFPSMRLAGVYGHCILRTVQMEKLFLDMGRCASLVVHPFNWY